MTSLGLRETLYCRNINDLVVRHLNVYITKEKMVTRLAIGRVTNSCCGVTIV